jgi:hypothetical protein
MPLTLPFPPPTRIWDAEHWWPDSRSGTQGSTAVTTDESRTTWAAGNAVTLAGTPFHLGDPRYGSLVRLGITNGGANQDQTLQFDGWRCPGPWGTQPASWRLDPSRVLYWWRAVIRWPNAGAVNPTMRTGIGLTVQTTGSDNWWTTDAEGATGGKGLILSGDGAGGLRFRRKALGALGAVAESVPVAWPGPLTEFHEVWWVIRPGRATGPASAELWIDRQLVLSRAWGATGTGTGNPEREASDAGQLQLVVKAIGATVPGSQIDVQVPVIWRVGRYEPLTGQELQP